MPIPTRQQVYEIFLNFYDPPEGTMRFFEHVDDNVDWQVTGKHRFSGRWYTKQDYWNATWANINTLLGGTGYKLEVPGGVDGVIGPNAENGWAVVEMKTVDTITRSGVPYEQHYSWHVRFNTAGKIIEAKAFLDSDHLEKVLGGEARKQASAGK
jgi:ketosteroid isomerase-like protein